MLRSGGLPCTFAGHQVALIGAQAFCKACKSHGRIAKAGGPRRMNVMGEAALDGDLVLCKCPTPQRIVATLAGEAWYDDMGTGVSTSHPFSTGLAFTATNATGIGTEVYDELVIANGPAGPISGYPYWVETSDGRSLFGYTNEQGQLPRIATISTGSLTIYWGDEALARHQEKEGA